MSSKKTVELFVILLGLMVSCMPEKRAFQPPPSQQQLKEALITSNKAYGEGRAKEVIMTLEPLVNRFPPGAQRKEALRLLALSYYSLRQYEKSSRYFRELLESFLESSTDKTVALNALRSFDRTGELERIPPLAEGLLKMPLSSEERREVIKALARSLRGTSPVKALKNYELLQKEGAAEAQEEAFSLIEGCSKEQLMEVERAFPNHPYGIFARITIARLQLKDGQPVKAFLSLEAVKDKAKEKGVFDQWQKAWRETGMRVKPQVLKIHMPSDRRDSLQFLTGTFLASGIFGQETPWRIRLRFDTPSDNDVVMEEFEKGVKGLLQLAKAEGLNEIAFIVPSGKEGERLKETVSKMAKALGVSISSLGTEDRGRGERVKGLLLVGDEKSTCSALTQREGKDYKVFIFSAKDPLGLLKVCGRYLEGAFLACPFWPNSTREGIKEFVRAYRSTYGKTPTFLAALGYFEALKALDPGFRSPLDDPFLFKVVRGSVMELPR